MRFSDAWEYSVRGWICHVMDSFWRTLGAGWQRGWTCETALAWVAVWQNASWFQMKKAVGDSVGKKSMWGGGCLGEFEPHSVQSQ